MAAALAKGTKVRIVVPELLGEILGAETNGDAFGYRVAFIGADGKPHERFFTTEQVEATGS